MLKNLFKEKYGKEFLKMLWNNLFGVKKLFLVNYIKK